jgi:thymidine kinase
MSQTYGKLTLCCGPMYASKTTELLKRTLWASNGQNRTVYVVKPAFDTRYSATKIVSHDGLSTMANAIIGWDDHCRISAAGADMVCFDEVQFFAEPNFSADVVTIIRELLQEGKEVVCAGLDMDWQGAPFPVTASLAAMADEILKLTANCTVCGRPAGKTFKKLPEGGSVELGSHDKYEARCNEHWH